MVPDSRLLSAVESLDYRVTAGDVAAQAGLDVRLAEQELLALASEANGHLQVSEAGDVVYLFPKNVRAILRNASLTLQLKALWLRIWNVLFYLIRISFGIVLIASLIIVAIAVFALFIVVVNQRGGTREYNRQRDQRSRDRYQQPYRSGLPFSLHDLLVLDHYRRRASRWQAQRRPSEPYSTRDKSASPKMNFLEAVFSFLFGDGNPNADLGDRRWRLIASVIRRHDGAVTAEQVAPYLDLSSVDPDNYSGELDDHMLPILQRFKGRPEVSPSGGLIYHFPALQVMAKNYDTPPVPEYLKEESWHFSLASPTQRNWVMLLAIANVSVVIAFELLFNDSLISQLTQAGQLIVGFVEAGYWVFFTYAIAFLLVPALRYLWVRRANKNVGTRNDQRLEWTNQLDQPSSDVQEKLTYAQKFAAETIVSADDLAYTTETDLMTQELLNAESIDQDWRRRLENLL
ncbi:MAG: hypothetical protein AAFQ57_04525 [Cyanobacteria bacterium J06626_14]